MAAENPTRGAPRIHGELLKLGLEISERTVSRYLARVDRHRDAGKRWRIFLHNHREAIGAMDFFTVPTATFRVLYCFFVIAHARRSDKPGCPTLVAAPKTCMSLGLLDLSPRL